MSLTPLDIRKASFATKLRGYDPQAVDEMLEVVAEELTGRLSDIARLEHELGAARSRIEAAHQRQEQLQEAVLHAQKLSKEMTAAARKEADLLVREAQVTADQIVSQAIEQAGQIESRMAELRAQRRELQMRLTHLLDRFRAAVEDDEEDARQTATVRTLPRRRPG